MASSDKLIPQNKIQSKAILDGNGLFPHRNLSALASLLSWIAFLFILFFSSCNPAFSEIDTTRAVIHHTASPDWSVERLRKIHVEERGWDDVGYHFIIRKDGSIEKGRDIHKQGAHAKGRNNRIGIALTGYDEFTFSQINSLTALLAKFKIKDVERHHEQCPGKGLNVGGVLKNEDT